MFETLDRFTTIMENNEAHFSCKLVSWTGFEDKIVLFYYFYDHLLLLLSSCVDVE